MRIRPRKTPFAMSLGERGEIIAWEFLMKQGYQILEKNYRCKIGEADVVARKNGRLVFVEVKTRSSGHFGRPEEAVHAVKQRKIVKVAQWYQKEKKLEDAPVAFEVVAVEWTNGESPRIRLIENAFQLDDWQ